MATALFAAATLVLVAACELVAGIEDIALTGDAGQDGASHASGGSGDAGHGRSPDSGEVDSPSDGPPLPAETGAASTDAYFDGTVDIDADAAAVTDATAPVDVDASASDSALAADQGDAAGLDATDAGDAGLVTELIDNMEAHNGLIPQVNGRVGEWYVFNDGTDGGIETPAPGGTFTDFVISPPRGTSMYAARMYGSGFKSWGAGIGFNVNSPTNGPQAGQRLTYDATPYRGFLFYARSMSGAPASVTIVVPDHNTDGAGGVCTTCGDHFGKGLTFTTSWASYVVYFTDLKQGGWGRPQPASLDAAQIYGANFIVSPNAAFDVWVDDIYFILP